MKNMKNYLDKSQYLISDKLQLTLQSGVLNENKGKKFIDINNYGIYIIKARNIE